MAAGVDPQSSWSLKPAAPDRNCSQSPSSETVFPLPRRATLTGHSSRAVNIRARFQGPGVIVVARVPSAGPVPPPMTVVTPEASETSRICGFPVSEMLHANIALSAGRLRRWPETAEIFLPGGEPPRVGARLVQTALGATLERVARDGPAELVEGRTARALVELNEHGGGVLRQSDLAVVRPGWREPLVTTFRDYVVHAAPAPFGDVAFACGLQLLDAFPPFGGPLDPGYVHVSVESAKLVGRERASMLGAGADDATIAWLLSPEHTEQQRSLITDRAASSSASGASNEDTITLATVDHEGNAVHLMQTVGTFFGTGAVAPGDRRAPE